MNKKCVSLLKPTCALASAFLLSCGFVPSFSASPLSSPAYENVAPVQAENHKFYVSNSRELALCANSVTVGDEIILTDNICLDTKICLKSSCCLNLNGHSILVKSDDEEIVIGQKEFSHTEKYTVKNPGYYTWESKVKTVEHPNKVVTDIYGNLVYVPVYPTQEISRVRVWHPETYEVRHRDIFKYDDNIDVIIKNGTIKKSEGKNGKNGQKDVWFDFNGENGFTPTAPVYAISGAVRFYNTCVKGADGGNGGDGSYQSLWHIPFGGGSAGNGGEGGDAGSAVGTERKEVKVLKDEFSSFSSGKPGKGGKAGKPNPNYWMYRGWKGEDGKDGKDSYPVVV